MDNTTTIPPDVLQAAVDELSMEQFAVRLDYAALGLIFYEYALTLYTERQHIWRQKKSLVFFLFVGVRYFTVVDYLLSALSDTLPIHSDKGCNVLVYCWYTVDEVSTLCISGISVLRSYAIWGRNRTVLFSLMTLVFGSIAVHAADDKFALVKATDGLSRQFSTCNADISPRGMPFSTTGAAIAIAFDTIVLILTVAKTVQQVMTCRRLGIASGLTYYVLRDGILYFCALELWLIAGVITSYVSVPAWTSSIFTECHKLLSAIVVQRLVLNLRQVEQELHWPTHITNEMGELNFAHGSFIGNIGAPLSVGNDEDLGSPEIQRDSAANGNFTEEGEDTQMSVFAIEEVSRK